MPGGPRREKERALPRHNSVPILGDLKSELTDVELSCQDEISVGPSEIIMKIHICAVIFAF